VPVAVVVVVVASVAQVVVELAAVVQTAAADALAAAERAEGLVPVVVGREVALAPEAPRPAANVRHRRAVVASDAAVLAGRARALTWVLR